MKSWRKFWQWWQGLPIEEREQRSVFVMVCLGFLGCFLASGYLW